MRAAAAAALAAGAPRKTPSGTRKTLRGAPLRTIGDPTRLVGAAHRPAPAAAGTPLRVSRGPHSAATRGVHGPRCGRIGRRGASIGRSARVGHGGATVYLAVFTLFHVTTAPLVTTVLVMNIVAAFIAWLMFRQAGHLRWRLLIPFVVASVPMAYLGGLLPLAGRAQALVLGLALLAGSSSHLSSSLAAGRTSEKREASRARLSF